MLNNENTSRVLMFLFGIVFKLWFMVKLGLNRLLRVIQSVDAVNTV